MDLLRALNRRKVLDCIRDAGSIARIEIAELTGASPATVSVITAELLRDGLIEAEEQVVPVNSVRRGRPKTLLRLRAEAAYAIGLKISLHQISVSLTDFLGDVLASHIAAVQTNRRPPEVVAAFCEAQIDEVIRKSGVPREKISGVGIGISGFVSYPDGVVRWSPMFGSRNVPFKQLMEQRLGLPVAVDNDSNLVGLAEKWFGQGRYHRTFLVVTVEHGVGMAIILDRHLFRGTHGFAGEFGHIKVQPQGALCRCGQRGCLEAYVADYAIVREAATFYDPTALDDPIAVHETLDKLKLRADSGETVAQDIFARAGAVLGVGVANAVNIFDPPVIIISGERTRSAQVFFDAMRQSLQEHVIGNSDTLPRIEVHQWGDVLWARGAAALVLEEFTPGGPASLEAETDMRSEVATIIAAEAAS
ncbi:Sugar kinase of the NBD/HSP70 family, may contain an N-terminal HTH domain [Faunimonas pinastri]|uniref:Sugar kinase of the NBD/HSP70 family, may contain an N-terminal HTH domain n=1 Tax=Faunimonas pinastri TaxID=1855383 RepID=A0A1H9KWV8_9HYPH|nr:ROK family transcriptional regulator [Faunimonas pinastri]SER03425.1 Sugar kinase of the NBD/HSP70 family, may contain an N-terminal HTH domain [Faunimonas pinastri]